MTRLEFSIHLGYEKGYNRLERVINSNLESEVTNLLDE